MVKILQRAKELVKKGVEVKATSSLSFFLTNSVSNDNFSNEILEIFSRLDDYDILSAIKEWVFHEDIVLSTLTKMIVNRNLFRIEIQDKPFESEYFEKVKQNLKTNISLKAEELEYFIFENTVKNQAYNPEKPIKILTKKGELKDIAKASDQLNVQALSKPVIKYYICYPKNFMLV